jgi:hypothetical protein
MDFAYGILLIRRFDVRRLAPVDAGNVRESRPVHVADGDVMATAAFVLIKGQETKNGLCFGEPAVRRDGNGYTAADVVAAPNVAKPLSQTAVVRRYTGPFACPEDLGGVKGEDLHVPE